MSEFYNYISKILLNHISKIQLIPGDRYSLQLDSNEEVNNLYDSIENCSKKLGFDNFSFKAKNNYESYYVKINDVNLLIAKTDDTIRPDYLTYLRNKVDKKGTEFENVALLFIHNSNLDSIIGGSKRLESDGMPLHVKSIERNIFKSIDESNLPLSDKSILRIFIANTKDDVYEASSSVFDFEEVFNILEQSYIKPQQFKNFGMFRDEKLNTFINTNTEQTLDKRIEDNMKHYEIVDGIHKYSDVSELEQQFDSNGFDKLKVDEWYDVEYEKVKSSKDNYDRQKKPIYLENELENENEKYVIWDRPSGATKARQRTRNIIVFNPNKDKQFDIVLKFDSKVFKNEVSATNKNVDINTNNTRLLVTFSDVDINTQATKITYYNLKFEIIIVNLKSEFLASIRNKYLISTNISKNIKKIIVISDQKDLILNDMHETEIEFELTSTYHNFNASSFEKICLSNLIKKNDDVENISIDLTIDGFLIPLMIKNDAIKPMKITSYKLWSEKLAKKSNYYYERKLDKNTGKESVDISQGTGSYYPTGDYRKYLEYEELIIESEHIHFNIINSKLVPKEIVIPESIEKSLRELFSFYRSSNTLPSLIYFNSEYINVAQCFLDEYFDFLDKIDENFNGDKELVKSIFEIGVVNEYSTERKIHFAPWHPMNLLYQIHIMDKLVESDFRNDISKYVNSTYLVPYINCGDNQLFKPIEQDINEWTTYVKYDNSKYNSSNKYVPRIISSKIKDFITHFKYLFMNNSAPLKIGLVNLGDCAEILKGIFEYYCNEMRIHKIEDLHPIEVHIYDNDNNINAFEELSGYSDIEDIKNDFGLRLQAKPYDEFDVLNAYRSKVRFYRFDADDVKYCHITFYKMDDHGSIGNNDMNNIETGLSLSGVVTDVTSTFVNGAYVTGFGSKYLSYENNKFLSRVVGFNTFAEYVNKLVAYDKNTILATAIKDEENELLSKIYNNSYWITFLDPKVDLNYFKENSKSKDLMIIHYSDQYSNSSGYDAITVTQKSKMYIKVIEEFLDKESDVEIKKENIEEIVNSFNVFNGEWLLRLVSRQLEQKRDQFTREKLSLFSAVKLFEAKSLDSDIYWIPVSSEELVRVSGGSGLRKKDSLLSPSSKGAFSDDILMIGIRLKNDNLEVSYYPIEVKIGNNGNDIIKKAKNQVIEAVKHFKVSMFDDDYNTFYSKLLRNQLIRIAITQVKKITMYAMWQDKDWNRLLDNDIVMKLINDEYEMVDKYDGITNDCGIITFTKNQIMRTRQKLQKENFEIDYYNYPMHDAFKYLSLGLADICDINDWQINKEVAISNNNSATENTEPDISDSDEHEDDFSDIKEDEKDDSITKKVNNDKNREYSEEALEEGRVYSSNKKEMQILFGVNQLTNEDIFWSPNSSDKVSHTNTGIIGTMGTGKTQFTKSLITQLKQQESNNVDGQNIGILIFDYKGDYVKDEFVNATGAKVYEPDCCKW